MGGDPRAVGGQGRHFAAFGETGESCEHPHVPQLRLGPHVQGTQPRRHAENHREEVSGLPVVLQREVRTVAELCVLLFSLCVYVWEGGPGGARFVLVGGGFLGR